MLRGKPGEKKSSHPVLFCGMWLIMVQKTYPYLKDLLFVSASAAMLVLAFPRFDLGFLAWFVLVPFFFVILRSKPLGGFFFSLLFGVIFYTGIFLWMFRLPKYTPLHHILLGVYLGPLSGVFGLFVSLIARRYRPATGLFAAPFIWVCLEYMRSNLSFLSLPWALLAHSQYQYPILIQIASITGVFGIGFLIVLVNSGLTILVWPVLRRPSRTISASTEPLLSRGAKALVGTAAVCFAVNLLYGYALTSKTISGSECRISVVQANIEQSKKWKKEYAAMIMETYDELTRKASQDKPALIVWPETATPQAMNLDRNVLVKVWQTAKAASVPLLLGSSQQRKFEENKTRTLRYQNSAFLLQPVARSTRNQRYDKIRLLPFGEYLPFNDKIPWASIGIPKIGGYVPGSEFTIFELPEYRFAVTICWENIFPDLVRRFIQDGAQFLVNITNEAWFGKTAAPYQFLSMSVFRAVENRVFVVRCANTGISCFIDPCGRVLDRVKSRNGDDIFVRGVLTASVVPQDSRTLYTQYGDWIVWFSICGAITFVIPAFSSKGRRFISAVGLNESS
ncbi:MAG: apolipoprotein N-acyltransferase [Desulfobacterales bacterium]|nr:MAG: apolipoprotein N-acyltransferase [Desulfobacterales bacterium]